MPPESTVTKPGQIEKLWKVWKRCFDLILDPSWPQTAAWARCWAVAGVASALCSFLHVFHYNQWLEFIPGWLIGEFTLIALFLSVPLPTHLSAWRRSMLSLLAPTCTWLPYCIRLFFGSKGSHPLSDFLEKKFNLELVPELFQPDPANLEGGAEKMAEVCLACSVVSVATFAILTFIRARVEERNAQAESAPPT